MADRRQSKRVTASLKAWCEGEDLTLLSSTLNLSKEGVFLRASRPFAPGSRLTLTIDELGVTAEVEVCWSRAPRDSSLPGVGLAILSFVRGGAAYERYIDQNSTRSGEHRLQLPRD
jgi:hypothetical protein